MHIIVLFFVVSFVIFVSALTKIDEAQKRRKPRPINREKLEQRRQRQIEEFGKPDLLMDRFHAFMFRKLSGSTASMTPD